MKKAKIALSAIAVLGVMGSVLAFKAIKRNLINYYTTTSYNATATQTLTLAITTNAAAAPYRYYTFVDNAHATAYAKVTKGSEL